MVRRGQGAVPGRAATLTQESEPPPRRGEHVILEWRGLRITLALARLFTGFWLTLFIGTGCFAILLGSDKPVEEQAAIAILSAVVTAWITALTRE